jgi:hypothetical protein
MDEGSPIGAADSAHPKGGIAALAGEARALGGALLCVACALAAYGIRYAFVEPEAMGAACERTQPWWCPIRTSFIVFTKWDGFGWLALALAAGAVAALLARRLPLSRSCAAAALAVGGFGMILYNATLSVPAAVIAGLCLVLSATADPSARRPRRGGTA